MAAACADALAGKLRRLMTPPFCIDGHELSLTASVGIALFPAHGRRLEELIGLAESALFDVVLAGGNGCRVAMHRPAHGTDRRVHRSRRVRGGVSRPERCRPQSNVRQRRAAQPSPAGSPSSGVHAASGR